MPDRSIALHRTGRFRHHVLVVLLDGDVDASPGLYLQLDEDRPATDRWWELFPGAPRRRLDLDPAVGEALWAAASNAALAGFASPTERSFDRVHSHLRVQDGPSSLSAEWDHDLPSEWSALAPLVAALDGWIARAGGAPVENPPRVTTFASERMEELAALIGHQRSQGLDFEVRHVLPDGWSLTFEADGYVFSGARSSDWEADVWRMVQFLAYKPFLSLRRTGSLESAEYELVSCTDDGLGFRAVFRAHGAVGEPRTPGEAR